MANILARNVYRYIPFLEQTNSPQSINYIFFILIISRDYDLLPYGIFILTISRENKTVLKTTPTFLPKLKISRGLFSRLRVKSDIKHAERNLCHVKCVVNTELHYERLSGSTPGKWRQFIKEKTHSSFGYFRIDMWVQGGTCTFFSFHIYIIWLWQADKEKCT